MYIYIYIYIYIHITMRLTLKCVAKNLWEGNLYACLYLAWI